MLKNLGFTITFFIFLALNFGYSQNKYDFDHNGQMREYFYFAPDDLPANAPLVFVMHGYTSNNNNIMAYSEMNQEARDSKFAVCYPQGLADDFGIPHWNANLTISNVNDIGFLSELALFLQNEYDLDNDRTFACGMSNGGFMSYTLACEKPDVFKAVASVTGTMSGYDWENCDPEKVVPVMQISGSADNVVPIDGSISPFGGWGGAPGMEAVRDFWVDLNECQDNTTLMINANFTTEKTVYYDGINDQEVWHYLITNWGHNWPTSASGTAITAAKEIWNFFSLVGEGGTSSNEDLVLSEQKTFQVYPNPSNGMVNVNMNDNDNHPFIISSIEGVKLMNGYTSDRSSIDLSGLSNGMYVLTINGISKRVVIMH